MPPIADASPTHEELVKVRELLTILVMLAVTGAFWLLARASLAQ